MAYAMLVGGLFDGMAVWVEQSPQSIEIEGNRYDRSTILVEHKVLPFYRTRGMDKKLAAALLSDRMQVAVIAPAKKIGVARCL